jgi:hypothetical protein
MQMMKKMSRFMVMGALMGAFVTISAAPAAAVTIVGRFNQTFGTVIVSLGELDFTPVNPGLDGVPTSGSFQVEDNEGSRTGVFNLPADPTFDVMPSPGTIGDLSSNPADANYVPVPTPGGFTRPNYITLAEKPTWQFTLTELVQGQDILGQPSPFLFTQLGPNVSVSIVMNGTAVDVGSGDPMSRWTQIVSAQYTNTTVANLIAIVTAGGSLPENTWSGTFEATAIPEVPEPATLLTFGAGSAILALRRRRAAKKASL